MNTNYLTILKASVRAIIWRLFSSFTYRLTPLLKPPEVVPKSQWVTVSNGPNTGVRLFISEALKPMSTGEYDLFLYDSIKEMEIDLCGTTVWDVGSHFGYHTLAFANLVGPQGNVVTFEPNPCNLERLSLHVEANSNLTSRIEISEFALSNEDGEHTMRLSSKVDSMGSSGSYLDYGSLPSDRFPESNYNSFTRMEVKVAKADTLIKDKKLPVPTFIKIDIEGAEVKFLEGAAQLLSEHKPFLAIEVHNINCMFYTFQLLSKLKYRLVLLDDGFQSSSRCFVFAEPMLKTRF